MIVSYWGEENSTEAYRFHLSELNVSFMVPEHSVFIYNCLINFVKPVNPKP